MEKFKYDFKAWVKDFKWILFGILFIIIIIVSGKIVGEPIGSYLTSFLPPALQDILNYLILGIGGLLLLGTIILTIRAFYNQIKEWRGK